MMDELELLKKDWQKKEAHFPKLSYDEIYQMRWKKSSSIVKWIFYISIFELLFWIVLNIIPFFWDTYKERFGEFETYGNGTIFYIITFFTFGVILVFIYYLFKSYRSISAVDNVKDLMENILRARKIVKYYVGYNLVMAALTMVFSCYYVFTTDEKMVELLNHVKDEGSEVKLWLVISLFVLLGIVIMVAFVWLFYKLIYGILLKRLKENYKELKQLEI